uniref:Uncharacterized protein n=1 Tax=Anguilla anguilla TaxID=7936 RepID=A0A0E9VN12_ANGAN
MPLREWAGVAMAPVKKKEATWHREGWGVGGKSSFFRFRID